MNYPTFTSWLVSKTSCISSAFLLKNWKNWNIVAHFVSWCGELWKVFNFKYSFPKRQPVAFCNLWLGRTFSALQFVVGSAFNSIFLGSSLIFFSMMMNLNNHFNHKCLTLNISGTLAAPYQSYTNARCLPLVLLMLL